MDRYLTPQALEQKIIDLVTKTRLQYELPDGCTGEVACTRLGLQIRRQFLPPGQDGMLVDHRIIVVNQATAWPSRVQFTIFHEIVHYLLNEDGELFDYFTGVLRSDPRSFDRAIERCCDMGAAEFLMPRARVRDMIRAEGCSVELVDRIAKQYGASIIAAAIQLALCAPVDCYVVLCGFGHVPGSSPPRRTLYIDYAPARHQVRYPLARFTPVPDDHLLLQAWEEQGCANGPSYIPFRSGARMPCSCEAKYLRGRVVGILFLGRPVPKGQLPLL